MATKDSVARPSEQRLLKIVKETANAMLESDKRLTLGARARGDATALTQAEQQALSNERRKREIRKSARRRCLMERPKDE